MITLQEDRLEFRFPEVHEEAQCSISFQRTLRIPDDEKDYPLPPGFGKFPLRHLDDYAGRIPEKWVERGGVIMPMFQSEALWIHFQSNAYCDAYPFAIKVATGKIDAITGERWREGLHSDPQDYVVIPTQPWLDGYCVERGVIRQFVAMPLGEGYTVEEQITGESEYGGIQIVAYPMKAEIYEEMRRSLRDGWTVFDFCRAIPMPDMGLAPGGRMKQEIYVDPYGLEAWDQEHSSRCFVTIANSLTWRAITGESPPTIPPTAADYSKACLPWFDYYDGDEKPSKGSKILAGLASVAELSKKKGQAVLPENKSADIKTVINIQKKHSPNQVRESTF